MKTVEINVIKSEEGLLKIREALKNNLHPQFIIKELATGKTWENFGGFNGNYWDLWLIKKGTEGKTKNTFIRIYLKNFKSILNELRYLKISPSKEFNKLLEIEIAEAEEMKNKSRLLIEEFSLIDKAKEWVSNDEGNSHKRRTRWANRAERMGADRGFGILLRDKCYLLNEAEKNLEIAKKLWA